MNSVDSMQDDSSDQSLPHSQSRLQAPGPSGSKFSIMYFNCRSMLPKFDELVALCSNDKPGIICLVETWLCEDVLDSEIHIPNYSILTTCPQIPSHVAECGGISMLTSKGLMRCSVTWT